MCRRLFGQLMLFWWCWPGGWTAGLKRGEDMEGAGTERRKYIIGWLTFGPGKRDDFMKLAVPYFATCREEKGCLFFEMNPSFTDPDVVTIAECFESAEAHSAHLRTPWFEAFWAELNPLGATRTVREYLRRSCRARFRGVRRQGACTCELLTQGLRCRFPDRPS